MSTRVRLDMVTEDLITSATTEHDGRHLDASEALALAGFLTDLCDMHDETAIDVELWPTLAAFVETYLGVPPVCMVPACGCSGEAHP